CCGRCSASSARATSRTWSSATSTAPRRRSSGGPTRAARWTCWTSIRSRRWTEGWRWPSPRSFWGASRDLDPRVVALQNLLRRPAPKGHAIRADLAEADAVAPPLPEKCVAVDAVGVGALVEDEEVVRHVEGPADREAFQHKRPSALGRDLERGHAPGG